MAAQTIAYVADWAARLRTRMYTQFRGKVTWELWITDVLGPQFQDLEDAGQTLFTLLDIDNSEGVQLDVIGLFVGQGRLGYDDVVYRTLLKTRVLSNKSTGTGEELYAMFRALYGEGTSMAVATSVIRSFSMRIFTAIDATQARIGLMFLQSAKETGARGILEWQQSADADTFCFDGGDGLGFGTVNDSALGGQFASAATA